MLKKIIRMLAVLFVIYILFSDDYLARRLTQLPELLLNYF
tara:strand:+ start:1177 stop:1296 length:120 start_codon:yes stop_codon:yes gene_type:complete